jgi:HEXXH motif-containing protein
VSSEDGPGISFHEISWADFDATARGGGGARVVHQLRRAERSRRLLLLLGIYEAATKSPDYIGPLASAADAWDLLARAEAVDPVQASLVLAHPYAGVWAGYTTRLLSRRISGTWPIWVHVGYLHTLAAAAAIRAQISFEISVPMWREGVILPTLGFARLPTTPAADTAVVRSQGGRVEVSHWSATVQLPPKPGSSGPNWWSVRELSAMAKGREFSVRLDDLDPYRDHHEPVEPQRLPAGEAAKWQELVADAWDLLVHRVPEFAEALRVGFDSFAPKPLTLFRARSASSNEAFGSAILNRPSDSTTLAAMIVHEFQHSRLSALTQIVRLWENDPRERLYISWRDDPRPIGGVFQGVYAFFGMTEFWRASACDARGMFEYACHREMTWQGLTAIRRDEAVTDAGRRFMDNIADVLGQWLREEIPDSFVAAAKRVTTDHRLGWRIRHLRPDPTLTGHLVDMWRGRRPLDRLVHTPDQAPTSIPDGLWTHARTDLTRLATSTPDNRTTWHSVPDVTPADLALVANRFEDAVRAYRADLERNPDSATALAGLTIALSAQGTSPAVRTLVRCPELVRAVHRRIRTESGPPPSLEAVADWIGRTVL